MIYVGEVSARWKEQAGHGVVEGHPWSVSLLELAMAYGTYDGVAWLLCDGVRLYMRTARANSREEMMLEVRKLGQELVDHAPRLVGWYLDLGKEETPAVRPGLPQE